MRQSGSTLGELCGLSTRSVAELLVETGDVRRFTEGGFRRFNATGIGWVTGFTIASEIGEINRFSSPIKLTGYTGLCPRVRQSGEMDRRGPLSKHGPRYLRWGLMEAAIAASSHPLYKERYQRTKRRLGRQRGAKVAQIELARKLTEAIWYMLTRNQPFKPFAPAGAVIALTA